MQQLFSCVDFDLNKVYFSVKLLVVFQCLVVFLVVVFVIGFGVDLDVDCMFDDDGSQLLLYLLKEEMDLDVVWCGNLVMNIIVEF